MTNRIKAIFTALLLIMAVSAMAGTAAAENQPPVAVIENTTAWGETPHDICVSGEYESYDPDGTIVSYDWDFGDGETSTEGTLWHTYNTAGNYTISLTVTDDEDATGYAYLDITIVPGDNPITDNGMKAYVWNSGEGVGWHSVADGVESKLISQGFDVIRHTAPTPSLIYQTISDNDIKIYWAVGHGSDVDVGTGSGACQVPTFGSCLDVRGTPLTIGIFQHCGDYLCYTPGRWLQESTQGDDDVVAQRFFGDGWCGDELVGYEGCTCEEYLEDLGSEISAQSFGANSLIHRLNLGYTYEDAVASTSWSADEGRKQGNRDLRYPQFCGDVNYDMIVDPADATLLQNHINDPNTYPIHSEWDGDVDGDGGVDIDDANLLSDHVNNPPAHPLNPRGWFVEYDWNEWDDDCVIADAEVSLACWHWCTNTPINGHLITDAEMSLLVYQWQTGDVC